MTLSRRSFLKGAISAAALAALPIKLPTAPEAVPITERFETLPGEMVPFSPEDFSEPYKATLTGVFFAEPPDSLFVYNAAGDLVMVSNQWSLDVQHEIIEIPRSIYDPSPFRTLAHVPVLSTFTLHYTSKLPFSHDWEYGEYFTVEVDLSDRERLRSKMLVSDYWYSFGGMAAPEFRAQLVEAPEVIST